MKTNKRKDNILKRWWNLCEPHKGIFLGQILTYVGYTIFLSLITIFAAKTINCMYESNWRGAFLFLALELVTIVTRNVFMHFEYIYYGKMHIHIRKVVANKLYNKLLSTKSSAMKEITVEKIVNISLNNMTNMAEFPDAVASFIAYSFQVVFTLVTVFVSNWIAGLIVAAIGVLNFFVYIKINKKLGTIMLERHETKDQIYDSYYKVVEGRSVINELGMKRKYKKELLKSVEGFGNAYAKYYKVYSFKQNLYYGIWNVLVYMITALMLYFVSKGDLDITVYLIIIPYLTTCTDKLNTLFDKTSNLENMRVDVDRVNLILELNDRQLIKYGKVNADDSVYNLSLVDVYYGKDDDKTKLKNVDMTFAMNGINVVKGERESGKRIIFDLLRRFKKPDSGVVLLDNLNLYDYNPKTFKNHIDYCSSHPLFIKGTIKENLTLVEKSMKKIQEACKKVGVLSMINKLPKKFNTKIEEIGSSGMLFLIGLARAILSKCNILMIYEIPQDTDDEFRQNIVELLTKQGVDKTVIIFTHTNEYDDIANSVFKVENQTVKIEKAR